MKREIFVIWACGRGTNSSDNDHNSVFHSGKVQTAKRMKWKIVRIEKDEPNPTPVTCLNIGKEINFCPPTLRIPFIEILSRPKPLKQIKAINLDKGQLDDVSPTVIQAGRL